MDARELLARALLRSEGDVYSEDPWEEAGKEMHAAYLHDADAIIEELEKGGFTIVRRAIRTNPGVPQEVD